MPRIRRRRARDTHIIIDHDAVKPPYSGPRFLLLHDCWFLDLDAGAVLYLPPSFIRAMLGPSGLVSRDPVVPGLSVAEEFGRAVDDAVCRRNQLRHRHRGLGLLRWQWRPSAMPGQPSAHVRPAVVRPR